MTIQPIDPDRAVAGAGIDPLPAWQLAAPELVVPVAVPYPGAGGPRRGEVGDPPRELGRSRGVAQLHRRKPKSAGEEVNVATTGEATVTVLVAVLD